MKNLKLYSKKICKALLILFPLVFFFSYFPIISFGSNDYMNFELSLPEIWLVLFFIISLPQVKDIYNYYGKKKLLITAVLPAYFSLTILWSENRPRALLTAGLFWLLVFAALMIIYYLKNDKQKKLRTSLIKTLLISATAVAAFCWFQCILDVAGVSRDATLLCRGCVSSTFGFPHPSGFAIEPQFMGNLLLAPVLLSFYLLMKKRGSTLLTLFLTTTLFLTLSRGAIYAFIIAFVLMLILTKKKSMVIRPIAYAFISLIVSIVCFGFLSVLGPTSDTFVAGTTKAIHQLSLGVIDLRPEEIKNPTPTESENDPNQTSDIGTHKSMVVFTPENSNYDSNAASFSGYVAESTDTRLSLNSLAIKTWATSPQYVLIGAGLGSAGPAMHRVSPDEIGPKEIVQNEYVSLLLETGLLGIILLVAVVIFTTVSLYKHKLIKNNALFFSVVIGFALTLLFFSGLPNALHIYLFPLIFFNFNFRSKDNFLIANKV